MRLFLRIDRPAALAAVAGALTVAVGCSTAPAAPVPTDSGKKILVVAAENFWGSIARQLGGTHVAETSIITNPSADPHDYEPAASDARTIASAQLVIVNGIGYDPWAQKLLAANPVQGRRTLTVGDLLRLKPGDNPHQWYSAAHVRQVKQAKAEGIPVTTVTETLVPSSSTFQQWQVTELRRVENALHRATGK